jgi:putative transposase
MQLVEKHIIKRHHKSWSYCDYLALQSKHLYNSANYIQRQYFFETKKYYNSIDIYHQTKNLEAYRYLPTKVSKQIVRRVSETWKGWLAALKDWSKHPDKYLSKPKMPGYKHKERGRNVVIYPIDAISKPALSNGIVKLSQTNIEFPTKAKKIDKVRIVPKLDHYVIEVVYTCVERSRNTVNDTPKSNGKYFAGIDLGLNKLISLLTYKAQLAGIEVFLTEENYTSIASALDADKLPTYSAKTETKPVFSGKRIKRGLYKTSTGRTINADTNGSLNIARELPALPE